MIEINNLTGSVVDKKFLKKIAREVLRGENKREIELSIALVNPAEIKKINKKYRRKNKPTDVLTFSQIQNYRKELSEIVICPSVIKKNAKKFKSNFKQELTRVLIHGILHLSGYDHEISKVEAERMAKKEKDYFKKLCPNAT